MRLPPPKKKLGGAHIIASALRTLACQCKITTKSVCIADGNRVIEEELVPFATSRKSCNEDDFEDLLQIARERQSHQ